MPSARRSSSDAVLSPPMSVEEHAEDRARIAATTSRIRVRMAKSYLPAKTANDRENDAAFSLAVGAQGRASCVHRRRGNPEAVAAGGGNLECGRRRETDGVWRKPAGPATDRLLPEDHLRVGRAKARRAAQADRTRMEKAGASAIAKSRLGGARVTTLRWGHVTDGRKAAGMRTPRGLRLPWGFSRLLHPGALSSYPCVVCAS